MKFTKTEVCTSKEILANDHYVAIPFMVSAADVKANEYGKKIVPAGTILPANDATAKGVLLHDVDVTDGDRSDTIVVHGFIKTPKLPEAPADEAIPVLKLISFMD